MKPKTVKTKVFPILNNHDMSKSAIGKMELFETFDWNKVNWDKYCFGAGYIPLKMNEEGETTKAELIEISLIPCPKTKDKNE